MRLNNQIEAIRSKGYELYGVSADTPNAHAALKERDNLAFELLSDPGIDFYREAGIIQPAAASVSRGVVVFRPDGTVAFREITDDPATALLDFLEI